jgi:hypothetical protein
MTILSYYFQSKNPEVCKRPGTFNGLGSILLPTKSGQKFKCGMRMKKCIKLVDQDVMQIHGEFVDDVLTVNKDYLLQNIEHESISFNTQLHLISDLSVSHILNLSNASAI